MNLKSGIKVFISIIFVLLTGIFFYQKWPSEFFWGIFFVMAFVVLPVCLWMTMRLWTRCPYCRKFGVIRVIRTELRKKGVDPHQQTEPYDEDEDDDESSLDFSLDLYDLFCRYYCTNCGFEWEEKPPPSYKFDTPPPSNDNGDVI